MKLTEILILIAITILGIILAYTFLNHEALNSLNNLLTSANVEICQEN